MGLVDDTFEKYLNPMLVETGTCYGDTVEAAKKAGFNEIISIEVSRDLYEKACVRFIADHNVQLVHGDSTKMLWPVIKDLKKRITFVLDAHYLDWGKDTRTDPHIREKYVEYPLVKELEIISRHSRKDHTIIIDDVRLFSSHFNITIKEVKEKLLKINPKYQIKLIKGKIEDDEIIEDEVMVAV